MDKRLKDFQSVEKRMQTDRQVRKAIVTQDHSWFFGYYFTHYITAPTAPFQHEMFAITEDTKIRLAVITAFRDSGKSTIFTLSGVLWSILGKPQKKFVIILSETVEKAQVLLGHIKHELEHNDRLKKDLGPFQEIPGQWGLQALVLSNFGAKIMIGSADQSIRSLRYLEHRPDLIILDDVEDLESVKTMEGRSRMWIWFVGEVLPAASYNVQIWVIGNHLHDDSLSRRLQKKIMRGEINGIYREYPIVDAEGNPLWPGRYPTRESIEAKRKDTMDEAAWYREYLLKILPPDDQVVHHEWIQRYTNLPDPSDPDNKFRYAVISVDPAISEKQTADFTGILVAMIYGWGTNLKVYILPYPINQRFDFPKLIETVKRAYQETQVGKKPVHILVESNAFQQAIVDELIKQNLPVTGIKSVGQDKRARLSVVTPYIKNGAVRFPSIGSDILIAQLVGFGVEAHDDLVDAFTMLVSYVSQNNGKDPAEVFEDFIQMNKRLLGNRSDNLLYKKF